LHIVNQQQPSGRQHITSGINDSKYYDFCFSVCISDTIGYPDALVYTNTIGYAICNSNANTDACGDSNARSSAGHSNRNANSNSNIYQH
jgi:hypothetical protein